MGDSVDLVALRQRLAKLGVDIGEGPTPAPPKPSSVSPSKLQTAQKALHTLKQATGKPWTASFDK